MKGSQIRILLTNWISKLNLYLSPSSLVWSLWTDVIPPNSLCPIPFDAVFPLAHKPQLLCCPTHHRKNWMTGSWRGLILLLCLNYCPPKRWQKSCWITCVILQFWKKFCILNSATHLGTGDLSQLPGILESIVLEQVPDLKYAHNYSDCSHRADFLPCFGCLVYRERDHCPVCPCHGAPLPLLPGNFL